MTLERCLDDAPKDTRATAVDQPNLAQPGQMGGRDVLVDERSDVRGREGVEIECAVDGDVDGPIVVGHGFL